MSKIHVSNYTLHLPASDYTTITLIYLIKSQNKNIHMDSSDYADSYVVLFV